MKLDRIALCSALAVCSALAAVTMMASLPLAQAAPGTKGKANTTKRRTTKDRGPAMRELARELNLTEAQQARIDPILKSTAKEVRAVRTNKQLDRQQKLDRLRQIQNSSVRRINTILNADQRKKFAEMLQRIRKQRSQMQS